MASRSRSDWPEGGDEILYQAMRAVPQVMGADGRPVHGGVKAYHLLDGTPAKYNEALAQRCQYFNSRRNPPLDYPFFDIHIASRRQSPYFQDYVRQREEAARAMPPPSAPAAYRPVAREGEVPPAVSVLNGPLVRAQWNMHTRFRTEDGSPPPNLELHRFTNAPPRWFNKDTQKYV